MTDGCPRPLDMTTSYKGMIENKDFLDHFGLSSHDPELAARVLNIYHRNLERYFEFDGTMRDDKKSLEKTIQRVESIHWYLGDVTPSAPLWRNITLWKRERRIYEERLEKRATLKEIVRRKMDEDDAVKTVKESEGEQKDRTESAEDDEDLRS